MKSSAQAIFILFFIAIINSQTFNCSLATSSYCGIGFCAGYTYTNSSCVLENLVACQQNHQFKNGTNECVNCSELNSTSCSTTCSSSMFDGTKCISCVSAYGIGCTSCNSTSCLSCRTGYTLNSNQSYCVSSSCSTSNCLSCQFNLNRCQLCQKGFQLNFTTFSCQQANCRISHCLTCNNTICNFCAQKYTLSDDGSSCLPICQSPFCTSCVGVGICAACKSGWILDPSAHICTKQCSNISVSNCFICQDNHICQGCLPTYSLIFEGTFCAKQSCTTNCLRCSEDNSKCLICLPGTQLKNNSANQLVCQNAICTINYCQQCSDESISCKVCHEGFYLGPNNRTCLPSCLSNIANCQICMNQTVCEFCSAGYKLETIINTVTNCSDYNSSNNSSNTNSSNCTEVIISSNTTVECRRICNITNCKICGGQNVCAVCADGLVLNADKTGCAQSCTIINCVKCSAGNICIQCRSDYIIQRNGSICAQTIEDGKVRVTHLNGTITILFCNQLFNNCTHCTQSRCSTCADKYALSLTGLQCLACNGIIENCLRCTVFACLQCSYPYLLSGNRCANCDIAHCNSCSANNTLCEVCQSGFSPVNGVCRVSINCTGGTVFQNGACKCPTGYYNGIACVDCANQNCISCSSSICYSCVSGFYPNGINCLRCMDNCQTCTSNLHCTKCVFPYSFLNGVCRKLGDGASGCIVPDQPGVVLRCPVGCSNCQVSSQNILICLVASDGYAIYGGVLTKCSSSCRTCSAQDPNICTSCFSRLRLIGGNCLRCTGFQARTCLLRNRNYSTSCLIGYTVVTSPGVCSACSENCARCYRNGAGKCDPGRCINGYVYNIQQQSCTSCFNNCPICEPDDLSICVSCGSGRYKNNLNVCASCPIQCSSCTSLTNCTSCQNSYTLLGSKCLNNVQYPYLGYSSDGNNFTCFAGFSLVNNVCVFNNTCSSSASCLGCPYGSFVSGGVCYPCQLITGCKNCRGNSSNNCDLCNPGYFLNENSCTLCKAGCSLCTNSQNCLRPSTGFYIVVDSDNNPTGQCIACTSPCASCIRQPTFCTSCISGFAIEGSGCFSNRLCKLTVRYVPKWFIATESTPLRFNRLFRNMHSVRNSLCGGLPGLFRRLGCARILRFRRCSFGSLQIQTDVDVSTASDASTASTDIQNSLAANGIDGQPILSSSVSAEGFQPVEAGTNLGLILGVSIPLGLILILIIFLMIRAQRKTEQQQQMQSWQNVNYIETDQKVDGNL